MESTKNSERVREVFAIIGSPFRLVGRLPVLSSFVWSGFHRILDNQYAIRRFGPSYRLRPWLFFDAEELEKLENLINNGSNDELWSFRQSQIDAFRMGALIGTLVAQAALTALALPAMTDVHGTARAFLSLSSVVSLLATFFTWLQQRSYIFITEPNAMRCWLSNGEIYDEDGRQKMRSSIISHQAMQLPFELVSIAITFFLGGLGVYFGSAFAERLALERKEDIDEGNRGVVIAFAICTAFILGLFGQLVGGKKAENDVAKENLPHIINGHTTGNERPGKRPVEPSVGFPMEYGAENQLDQALQRVNNAYRAFSIAKEELASFQ